MKSKEIFFCEIAPIPFYEFIINKDLEKLLEVDVIQIETKNFVKTIETIPKINSCHKSEKLFKNSANNIEFSESNETVHETDSIEHFKKLLTRNETFICQFTESDKVLAMSNSIRRTLKEFITTNSPLNRFSWKIMKKLNIFMYEYPEQYVKINGNDVLICGSLGGNQKNFTLKTNSVKKKQIKTPEITIKKAFKPKFIQKRLLLSQVNYNLKPGPLCKKPLLNQMSETGLGDIQLVNLPQIGLQISPSVGNPLDMNICKYLKQARCHDGKIDTLWANFAVSNVQSEMSQKSKIFYTFKIPYENNRSRVLMRKDLDAISRTTVLKKKQTSSSYSLLDTKLSFLDNYKPINGVEKIVSNILSDILKSICIGEIQDDVLTYDPIDDVKIQHIELVESTNNRKKKHLKEKYVNELKKLDVTVIELDLEQNNCQKVNCDQDFCKFGCVCNSLKTNYYINEHCGLSRCMFDCKCNLDENTSIELCKAEKSIDISHSAVANLQHQVNRYLSKEEKKFHHTVIRSNNQTIFSGPKRRGVRTPKRFEDFCREPSSDKFSCINQRNINSNAVVSLSKLPESVIGETWCMVHNLYRCFCRGTLIDGKQFKYSNLYNEENCHDILKKTLSVPKIGEKYIENSSCARTDYNPKLIIRGKKKISDYKERNDGLKFTEMKDTSKQKLLLDRINTCSTNNSDIINNTETLNFMSKKVENSDSEINMENTKQDSDVQVVTTKQSPPNKHKESERYMTIITKNIPLVSQIIKSKTVMPLITPEEDKLAAIPLHKMIADYLIEEIFIWITTQPPYKQYITLENDISCQLSCINVSLANEFVIKLHPPFVKEIVQLSLSTDTYVLLIGKPFAWEIAATMKSIDQINPNCKSESKIISFEKEKKSIDSSFVKLNNNHKTTLKIQIVPNCLSGLTSKSNNWFMLLVGLDFTMIKINSKDFSVTRQSILQAIQGARRRSRFIRFVSKQPLKNNKQHFGLYASPVSKELCAFLGPYDTNISPDIHIVDHNLEMKQTKGMWLNPSTHHKLQNILDFLSTQPIKTNEDSESRMFAKFHILPELSQTKSQIDFSSLLNLSLLKSQPISRLKELANTSAEHNINYSTLKRKSPSFLTEPVIKIRQTNNLFKKHKNVLHLENKKETCPIPNNISSFSNKSCEDVIFLPNDDNVVEISDSE